MEGAPEVPGATTAPAATRGRGAERRAEAPAAARGLDDDRSRSSRGERRQQQPPAGGADETANDEAERRADDAEVKQLRRQGLPSNALVEREGDLFVYRLGGVADWVAVALAARSAALSKVEAHGLNDGDVLPYTIRKVAVQEIFDAWCQEERPMALFARQVQVDLPRPVAYQQTRQAFRASMHARFGGFTWLHLLVAAGAIDTDMVAAVNEEISAVVALREGRTAGHAAVGGPAPRGRPAGPTDAKRAKSAREVAKRLDREVTRAGRDWSKGDETMSRRQWYDLLARRDRSWDFAENASDDVGLPYTDRHGARRFEDKEGDMMVERVLRRYCDAVHRPHWERLYSWGAP